MDDPTAIDLDFDWTPWGWLRIRRWANTMVSGTPGSSAVSIQMRGTSIVISHG